MISEEAFAATVDLINEAALNPPAWKAVLLRLATLTNCVAGGLTVENSATRKGRPLTYFGFDDDHVAKTFDYYLPMNPLFSIADKMAPGFIVANGDVIAPDRFRRTEFYNGWARPQKIGSPLTVVLHRSEDSYCPLTLVRPDGAGEATAEDRALLRRLAPQLIRALGVSLRLESLALRNAAIEAALARISIAVFVVDDEARIAYANPAAEALLKRSASLQSKDGALQCGDAAASRKLQTAIARACRRDQPAEFGEAFIPSEGEEAMEIAVAPATSQSPFAPLLSAAPCCVVFANDRSQRRWDGLRRFARHYRLTPSEARLLAAIVGGGGLAQAAEATNVKPSTAHTHLKRVFAKTDTNRQGELINLALTAFLPLQEERSEDT